MGHHFLVRNDDAPFCWVNHFIRDMNKLIITLTSTVVALGGYLLLRDTGNSAEHLPPTSTTPAQESSNLSTAVPQMPSPSAPAPPNQQAVQTPTASPPMVSSSIPMDSAHEHIMAKPKDGQLTPHQKMEQEPKDTTWAWEGEQKVSTYLADQGLRQALDVNSVVCRTTLCEIQAYAPNTNSPEGWQKTIEAMKGEPWFATTFSGVFTVTSTGSDGRLIILTYLQKAGQANK